jgi:hypothetical protein
MRGEFGFSGAQAKEKQFLQSGSRPEIRLGFQRNPKSPLATEFDNPEGLGKFTS